VVFAQSHRLTPLTADTHKHPIYLVTSSPWSLQDLSSAHAFPKTTVAAALMALGRSACIEAYSTA
jgi:hypothetical protein